MDQKPGNILPPATEQGEAEHDDRSISPTGGMRGTPAAEHGAYGMVRTDAQEAQGLRERQIRGVEPVEEPANQAIASGDRNTTMPRPDSSTHQAR